MLIIITSLLLSVFVTVATLSIYKHLDKQLKTEAENSSSDITSNLQTIGEVLEKAIAMANQMEPLDDYLKLKADLETQQAEIKTANSELKRLNSLHDSSKKNVKEKEDKHASIKARREECLDKAEEISAKKEELNAEYVRMVSELQATQEELRNISQEVEMTMQQKAIFDEIVSTLDSALAQLDALRSEYSRSSERFINLEKQFEDLENEYSKLIENQLV